MDRLPAYFGPDSHTHGHAQLICAKSLSPQGDPFARLVPKPAAYVVAPSRRSVFKEHLIQRYQSGVAELCKIRWKHPVVSGDEFAEPSRRAGVQSRSQRPLLGEAQAGRGTDGCPRTLVECSRTFTIRGSRSPKARSRRRACAVRIPPRPPVARGEAAGVAFPAFKGASPWVLTGSQRG
jgi:hypothetical protein